MHSPSARLRALNLFTLSRMVFLRCSMGCAIHSPIRVNPRFLGFIFPTAAN